MQVTKNVTNTNTRNIINNKIIHVQHCGLNKIKLIKNIILLLSKTGIVTQTINDGVRVTPFTPQTLYRLPQFTTVLTKPHV